MISSGILFLEVGDNPTVSLENLWKLSNHWPIFTPRASFPSGITPLQPQLSQSCYLPEPHPLVGQRLCNLSFLRQRVCNLSFFKTTIPQSLIPWWYWAPPTLTFEATTTRLMSNPVVPALYEYSYSDFENHCYTSSVESTSAYDKPMPAMGQVTNRRVTILGDISQGIVRGI